MKSASRVSPFSPSLAEFSTPSSAPSPWRRTVPSRRVRLDRGKLLDPLLLRHLSCFVVRLFLLWRPCLLAAFLALPRVLYLALSVRKWLVIAPAAAPVAGISLCRSIPNIAGHFVTASDVAAPVFLWFHALRWSMEGRLLWISLLWKIEFQKLAFIALQKYHIWPKLQHTLDKKASWC